MAVEATGDVSCYSLAIVCRGVWICVDCDCFASKILVDMEELRNPILSSQVILPKVGLCGDAIRC